MLKTHRITLDILDLTIYAKTDNGAEFRFQIPPMVGEIETDFKKTASDTTVTSAVISRVYSVNGFLFTLDFKVDPPKTSSSADLVGSVVVISAPIRMSPTLAGPISLGEGASLEITVQKTPSDVNLINVEGGVNIRTGPIKIGF